MNVAGGAWRPDDYLKFADDRLRPGFDLLARVGGLPPGPVWDLGCGAGQHAQAMAARWPGRAVFGLDSAPSMLAKARAAGGRVTWVEGDVRTWRAPQAPALIFSNAALQWVDGHDELLPGLFRQLAPGGVLAIQMPRNDASPSQVLMRAVADEQPWASRIAGARLLKAVAGPDRTWEWLRAAGAATLDIWQTEYVHELTGEHPVFDWIHSTALRPVLERLEGDLLSSYEAELKRRLLAAYPKRAGGITLFPFLRLFIVARRPA